MLWSLSGGEEKLRKEVAQNVAMLTQTIDALANAPELDLYLGMGKMMSVEDIETMLTASLLQQLTKNAEAQGKTADQVLDEAITKAASKTAEERASMQKLSLQIAKGVDSVLPKGLKEAVEKARGGKSIEELSNEIYEKTKDMTAEELKEALEKYVKEYPIQDLAKSLHEILQKATSENVRALAADFNAVVTAQTDAVLDAALEGVQTVVGNLAQGNFEDTGLTASASALGQEFAKTVQGIEDAFVDNGLTPDTNFAESVMTHARNVYGLK